MAIGIFTLRQQLRGLLSKNWTGTIKTPYVEYLVVGGGGGGGGQSAGGGGGGGVVTGLLPTVTGTSYTVTVGGGGAGGTTGAASSGVNSVISSVIAVGGGGGGTNNTGINNGLAGGSGGGAAPSNSVASTSGTAGQGVFGQGNAGGANAGSDLSSWTVGAGGGGAGTVGLDAVRGTSGKGGNGGAGIASAISGTVTPYGGGGGGGMNSGTAGTGGVGGGGNGGVTAVGTAGQANTGGGGGAGGGGGNAGGAGGSGIVIVSYPDIYAPLTTGGATSPTVSTSGSGSLSFNGAGTQSLNYAGQSAFSLSSGDFTIEGWVLVNTTASAGFVIDFRNGATSGAPCVLSSGTTLQYFDPTATTLTLGTITAGTWYHFAISRTGTALKTFFNGNLVSSITDGATLGVGSDRPVIGGYGPDPTQSPLNGYISNLRVVKGTGLYSASFTPSTGPLPAVSGTSLLLNTVSPNAYLDSSSNSFVPVLRGTPGWNQQSPFVTGLGYKNRVYTWINTGAAGSTATGTFTV